MNNGNNNNQSGNNNSANNSADPVAMWVDMLGAGGETAAEGGPGTGDGTFPNIDDENYNVEKFRHDPLNLNIPPLEPEKKTCEQECAEKMAERRKRCNEVRKRVALALKEAGCPSKVTGYAKKSKCPSRTSYKKKTLVCKRK